jgi:hypothetical protein
MNKTSPGNNFQYQLERINENGNKNFVLQKHTLNLKVSKQKKELLKEYVLLAKQQTQM